MHADEPDIAQVKAEVWISIISGSKGIIYFAHQFKPNFIEAGLLADIDMCNAINDINKQIKDLAPVFNSKTDNTLAAFKTYNSVPVEVMIKKYRNKIYIFAIPLSDGEVNIEFKIKGLSDKKNIVESNEYKKIKIKNSAFTDNFRNYALRIYSITL